MVTKAGARQRKWRAKDMQGLHVCDLNMADHVNLVSV